MANKNPLKSVDSATAYQIVNAAYNQAVGDAAVDTLTLDDFTDSGVAFASLSMAKDKFFKALIDQVVNFYTDTAYESEYQDPYYVDYRRFCNVLQVIDIESPAATESHAWKDFSPNTSTTPPTYATVGTYQVVPSTLHTKYYPKSISWEINLWINEEQMSDGFRSAGELQTLVDRLYLSIDNKMAEHKENLTATNRNSWIANKLIYAASQGAKGIHKVDLLAKFNAERGGSLTTIDSFLKSPEALRFASAQMILYSQYLRKQSSLFNVDGLVKFCPKDRMVVEILSAFENAINEVALSTTFHDELVAMPKHISTPAWQGLGIDDSVAGTSAAAFDQVSKIDVSVDAGDIEQAGIVGLIVDQYAIMNTIRSERVAHQHFDVENLDMFSFQQRSSYINNMAQPGVVFTIEPTT